MQTITLDDVNTEDSKFFLLDGSEGPAGTTYEQAVKIAKQSGHEIDTIIQRYVLTKTILKTVPPSAAPAAANAPLLASIANLSRSGRTQATAPTVPAAPVSSWVPAAPPATPFVVTPPTAAPVVAAVPAVPVAAPAVAMVAPQTQAVAPIAAAAVAAPVVAPAPLPVTVVKKKKRAGDKWFYDPRVGDMIHSNNSKGGIERRIIVHVDPKQDDDHAWVHYQKLDKDGRSMGLATMNCLARWTEVCRKGLCVGEDRFVHLAEDPLPKPLIFAPFGVNTDQKKRDRNLSPLPGDCFWENVEDTKLRKGCRIFSNDGGLVVYFTKTDLPMPSDNFAWLRHSPTVDHSILMTKPLAEFTALIKRWVHSLATPDDKWEFQNASIQPQPKPQQQRASFTP